MNDITVKIHAPGDPSVGVKSLKWTITGCFDEDPYEREKDRELLEKTFRDIAGGDVYVMFSDEEIIL